MLLNETGAVQHTFDSKEYEVYLRMLFNFHL